MVQAPTLSSAGPHHISPKRIGILTPVLDDWVCFGSLVREISAQYTGAGLEFYVIVVDDGSAAPFDPACLALPSDTCIAGIEMLRLALNLGHQRAIAVGLCAFADREDIDVIIVMDSDGEDRPIDIATLLAECRRHPGNIILANRAKRSEPA